MPGGRPSNYDQGVLDDAYGYLDHCEREGKLPSVVGLCRHIGRSKSTAYKWAKEEGKEEFSDILEQVAELQEERLIENGLSGEYNATITKMMLTKHGYADALNTNVTGDIGTYDLTDTERAARITALLERAGERRANEADN